MKFGKQQVKVKGAKQDYIVKYAFATPVNTWSRETFLANIKQGLKYAIRAHIVRNVLDQERNLNANNLRIQKAHVKYANDPNGLAIALGIYEEMGVVTKVCLEYILSEHMFSEEMDEPEENEDGDDGEDNEDSDEDEA